MKLRKLLTSRRGISMAEVVIALTVVSLVSAAAISVVVASIRYEVKYVNETTALSYCESAVECVRFADDYAEALKLLTGDENPVDNSYKIQETGLKLKVVQTEGTNEYEISVVQNDDVIYELTYEKN